MLDQDTSVGVFAQPPHIASGAYRWQVAATSVCGTSHQKREQPCQDAHYWSIVHNDVLVAAVADGAGSAALGKVGATLAVCSAATTVSARYHSADWPDTDEDWHQCLVEAVHAAQTAIAAEARARQVTVREFAATLILVVAMPELVAVIQIGDGAVVVGDAEEKLITLTIPQTGEYANETTFLVSPNALDTAQFRVWHGLPRHVVAFSDGLQRLALNMPDGNPYAPFFLPLFRFMEAVTETTEAQAQVEALLSSRRLRERTDDDITLLLGSLVSSGCDASTKFR
jgi:serine/threonine protein phosphatase PrpC